MLEKLSYEDFIEKLKSIHGKVYLKTWLNSPGIYYYDTPDFNGGTSEVGIYTNETHYYIKEFK